jgi:hypothetical protein
MTTLRISRRATLLGAVGALPRLRSCAARASSA